MPALICAWREGIWPWPACSTWPMTTCSTCSGSTPARSSAASIADRAELGGVERGQAAAHLADRGARGAEDHGLWHGGGSLLSSVQQGREIENGSRPPLRSGAARRAQRARRGTAGRPAAAARRRRTAARGYRGARWTSPRPLRAAPRAAPTRSRSGSSRARDARRTRPRRSRELLASGEARRSFRALAVTHAAGVRWLTVGLGSARRARRPSAPASPPRWRAERARELSARGRSAGRCPTARATASPAALVEGTILARLPLRAQQVRARRAGRRPPRSSACSSRLRRRARRAPSPTRRWSREAVEPRARSAEPPGNDLDPDRARRVRAGARGGDRRACGRGRGPRGDRSRAAWAPSPRSRRAPTQEPALITLRYERRRRAADAPGARLRRQGGDVRQRRHLAEARGEDVAR